MTKREKIEKLLKEYKYHREMAKKIKQDLNTEKKPFENKHKDAWIKAMRFCTEPFAKYNQNLNSYLKDSTLFEFNKLVSRISSFNEKIDSLEMSEIKINKVNKLLTKIDKLKSNLDKYLEYDPKFFDQHKKAKAILRTLKINEKKLNDQKSILNFEIINKSGTVMDPGESNGKNFTKEGPSLFS